MSSNGFQDRLQGLTGRALKRVQHLTGAEVAESDNIQLIFAVGYVSLLQPHQIKNWTKEEQAGWDLYLDNTSYAEARVNAGVVEEDSDPKDAPAN
ncbi:hypothetical protein CH298_04295 [Rhodococcoides fascians]|uniref:hypothetical protein n=1 Tax=Rhodococcoides fascians TaxID=1828 RepID=UPI000B9A37AB|nr:hypothetical protein [Rhodococcus fascians]OZE92726.1 hypothetical protein CH303_04290 [Rhodococcus fascians]OZF23359.1 hypothetical protein CH298_04295 [Rhodococcus fascians]OZF25072.1 hypothetical protein CH297_04290 [Rhodococcus fascians]OZF72668.1 hypothetical protein CH308_04295 [Rhodococcus fascians]OZF73967.1 hypothetical protein CH307_04295 [Rhodococcus fascians]